MVGTSNNESKIAARVMFDTPQHQNSCHLVRCLMLSVHRRYRLLVICKSLRMRSWTSTRHLLKRSRDTPSSTQPSDFTNSKEFAQRAQTASVPLPRTPEQVVLAPETPFQPVPHGNAQRQRHAFDATIPKISRRRDGARDATRGKFENCRIRPIILRPCATSHVQRGKHTCSFIHVARGSCW